jgi:solute carrier family 25 phosphate transporter 3
MAKFAVYEVAFEKICTAAGKKPTELTEGTKTAFNLSAGLIAGLAAAFISQPADTLLSRMNKTAGAPGQGMVSRIVEVRPRRGIVWLGHPAALLTFQPLPSLSLLQLSQQLGIKGLFGGMGARFVMIGSITAGQFGLYGGIKSALGATGGVEIAKA